MKNLTIKKIAVLAALLGVIICAIAIARTPVTKIDNGNSTTTNSAMTVSNDQSAPAQSDSDTAIQLVSNDADQPIAQSTNPVNRRKLEEQKRVNDILNAMETHEIRLDRNKRPYYLGLSCVYGEEDQIVRYYLTASPAQRMEILVDENGDEYVIDAYGDICPVRDDTFHEGLKYAYIPDRHVVQEGDTLASIISSHNWYTDFSLKEAIAEYMANNDDVQDPDNLTVGQVITSYKSVPVYLLTEDGGLIWVN